MPVHHRADSELHTTETSLDLLQHLSKTGGNTETGRTHRFHTESSAQKGRSNRWGNSANHYTIKKYINQIKLQIQTGIKTRYAPFTTSPCVATVSQQNCSRQLRSQKCLTSPSMGRLCFSFPFRPQVSHFATWVEKQRVYVEEEIMLTEIAALV